MVEVGKTYEVFAPRGARKLDEIEVTEILGTTIACHSLPFDYDTAYDLADGITLKEIEADKEEHK